jgi:hypothetical protein
VPVKLQDPAKLSNPYENFTIQHVKGKDGKAITVNSLKELRAAEKKHHFALAVASDENAAKSDAPTNDQWAGDIRHGYNWKFARDPKRHSDRDGVSAGATKRSEIRA